MYTCTYYMRGTLWKSGRCISEYVCQRGCKHVCTRIQTHVVAQWEGLSAAPVGGNDMSPFSNRLPRTLALGSLPRPGPGGARCTGAERLPNSNSGACCVSVLSRPAALPGVSVLSESELAKYYQLQQVLRDANVCAVAVIAARWTKPGAHPGI